MKAAVASRDGLLEVVEIREEPTPVPRDNEVLVRVHATTICHGDRIVRSGPLFVRLKEPRMAFPSSPQAPFLDETLQAFEIGRLLAVRSSWARS